MLKRIFLSSYIILNLHQKFIRIIMELVSFLSQYDIYSLPIVAILIIAGFLVGFINTFAGSGTAITYSLFIFLGLPANFANGTIRLGVIMQTLVASLVFFKQNKLEIKKGLIIAIPIVLGSITGAKIAVSINKDVFEIIIGCTMILMLFFVFKKPKDWIEGKAHLRKKKLSFLHLLVFFLIGIYGGFIHIGVGIFLLAALVLMTGYDLVSANAIKIFVVFIYSPFALAVFMYHGQLDYAVGLISAIGNFFGGLTGSYFVVKKGAGFVRWILIVVMILFAAKLFGFFKLF